MSIGNTVLKTGSTFECTDGQKCLNQTKGTRKQAGIANIIANKMDFRLKVTSRDTQGHLILIKRTINQKELLS